jgi:acetyl esterase/lipase
MQESLATSVHDVQMILNYLSTRGDLDMDRVGMFGQGSGGSIAIMASAIDSRIKAVDALGPWGDWPDWIAKTAVVPDADRAKFSNPEFLARVAQLDPLIWLPKMKAKSFRLQNVRMDPAVPDQAEEKLEAVAPEFTEINQFADDSALYPMAAGAKLFGWMGDKLNPSVTSFEASEKTERIHFYPSRARKADDSPLPMGAKKD